MEPHTHSESSEEVGNDPNRALFPLKKFEKSTAKDILITGGLIIAPLLALFLPSVQRVLLVVPVCLIALAISVFWLVSYCRKNMRLPEGASRVLSPGVQRLICFSFFAGSFVVGRHSTVGEILSVLFWVSLLATAYFADALVNHASRPFDSIESRAERDAAAICFLVVGTLSVPVLYSVSELGPEVLDFAQAGAYITPLLLLGMYVQIRKTLINHIS